MTDRIKTEWDCKVAASYASRKEREAIVAWLRANDGLEDCYNELKDQWLSDRIARGEHHEN